MKCKSVLILVIFVTSLLINTSAYSAIGSSGRLVIQQIDYVVENIHPSYWGSEANSNEPRLYFNFFIYIENLKDQYKHIKSIKIYDPYDLVWMIDLKEDLHLDNGYIGGYGRWYNSTMSTNGSMNFLRDFRLVIAYRKETVEQTFSIPEPGTLNTTKTFIYTEDYRGKLSPESTPAIKQGIISRAAFKDYTFTIDFTVNDARVANGQILFYDENLNYVGESAWFVNPFSEEIHQQINSGNHFHRDGTKNTFVMDLATVEPQLDESSAEDQICPGLL